MIDTVKSQTWDRLYGDATDQRISSYEGPLCGGHYRVPWPRSPTVAPRH